MKACIFSSHICIYKNLILILTSLNYPDDVIWHNFQRILFLFTFRFRHLKHIQGTTNNVISAKGVKIANRGQEALKYK